MMPELQSNYKLGKSFAAYIHAKLYSDLQAWQKEPLGKPHEEPKTKHKIIPLFEAPLQCTLFACGPPSKRSALTSPVTLVNYP